MSNHTSNTTRICIRLPQDIHRALIELAVRTDRGFGELVVELMQAATDRHRYHWHQHQHRHQDRD